MVWIFYRWVGGAVLVTSFSWTDDDDDDAGGPVTVDV